MAKNKFKGKDNEGDLRWNAPEIQTGQRDIQVPSRHIRKNFEQLWYSVETLEG